MHAPVVRSVTPLRLAACLVLVGAPVPSATPLPAQQADRQALAERARDSIPDPGDVEIRHLWSTVEGATVGSLSPDGRRVLFVDWGGIDDPGLRGHADVAFYDIATGDFHLVTDRPSLDERDVYPSRPIWSGDGEWVVYADWVPGWTHQQIRMARPDGSEDHAVLDHEQVAGARPMAVSSSGEFIVVLLRLWDRATRIAVVSTADGSLEVLKTLGTHMPASLGLSPDDRFIAYDRPGEDGSDARDVFALAVDGSVDVPVGGHPGDDVGAFWTPGGDRIVFMSDRAGERGLWVAEWSDDGRASEPRPVHVPLPGMRFQGFTRDGAAFLTADEVRSEVYVAELTLGDGGSLGEPSVLSTTAPLSNLRPAWSPDGTRVAWLSLRGPAGESPHLVVKVLHSGEEIAHALPATLGGQPTQRPEWTLDGRHVWVDGRAEDPGVRGRVTYRIDARTGRVRQEAYPRDRAGIIPGYVTQFPLVDGRQARGLRSLGVRLLGVGEQRLFAEGDLPLRPGETAITIRQGVHRVTEGTPNFADPCSKEGLEPLIPSDCYFLTNWGLSPDGLRLAVAAHEPGSDIPNVLWVVPLDGSDPVELGRMPVGVEDQDGRPHFETVRWSPDGGHVLYAVHETGTPEGREADIWMVAADGGTTRRLGFRLTPYRLGNLRFHPDGDRVAWDTWRGTAELWLAEGLPWQGPGR